MRKKIIITFILISLSVIAAYKVHSAYFKEIQQDELEGKQLENKKSWTRASKDMIADQIKEILGEPERVLEGPTTIWFYRKGGSVNFVNGKSVKCVKPFSWDY